MARLKQWWKAGKGGKFDMGMKTIIFQILKCLKKPVEEVQLGGGAAILSEIWTIGNGQVEWIC